MIHLCTLSFIYQSAIICKILFNRFVESGVILFHQILFQSLNTKFIIVFLSAKFVKIHLLLDAPCTYKSASLRQKRIRRAGLRIRFFDACIAARSESFGALHRRNTVCAQCLNDAVRRVAAAVRYSATRHAVNICRRNTMASRIKTHASFGEVVRHNSFALSNIAKPFRPARQRDR